MLFPIVGELQGKNEGFDLPFLALKEEVNFRRSQNADGNHSDALNQINF